MNLTLYINELLAHGRCCFTLDEAEKALQQPKHTIIVAIKRSKEKNKLASPARGFYVIVTPEYQVYGCLPPEQFIPYLMEYLQSDYYACLLTAAMYHGATHQAPQVFQVMAEKDLLAIHCGKVIVEFITKRELNQTPTQSITTPKSMLKISTPEATAMDLLRYPQRCGGLNHIATVLSELAENINPDKLTLLLEQQNELAWKQRLGYMLDLLGAETLANAIRAHLDTQKRLDYVLLMPGLNVPEKKQHIKKWKIIENTSIESDI